MGNAHFKQWISLGGRIGRAEYWLSYMLPSGVVVLLSGWGANEFGEARILVVGGLAAAYLFTLGHVKRFRDLKLPGVAGVAAMGAWWTALVIVAFAVFALVVTAGLIQAFFTGITNAQWSPALGIDLDWVIPFFVAMVGIPLFLAGFVPGVSARETDDRPPLSKVVKRAGVAVARWVGVPAIALAGYGTWHFLDQREPALIRAVHSTQVARVRAALERGADPNQRTTGGTVTPMGSTALEIALRRRLRGIATVLVEFGADASGWPLVDATERGDSTLVEAMLAQGANVHTPGPPQLMRRTQRVNQTDPQDVTPLMAAVAAEQRRLAAEGQLARREARLESAGEGAPLYAYERSEIERARSDWASRSQAGLVTDWVGLINVLLDNGANDSSAFAKAVLDGNLAIVGAFLDHGFDVNAVYSYRWERVEWEGTPLALASRRLRSPQDMVALLLSRGADPRLKDQIRIRQR